MGVRTPVHSPATGIIPTPDVALAPGARLGPYEVLAQLGAGGMGEVYRARDTRLKREVAIKILPPSLVGGRRIPGLARFQARSAGPRLAESSEHRARSTASKKSDGVHALVMELVEGPTLADRIAHGRDPARRGAADRAQIAEALEAAHEQGIIHRDLKPANIKVRAGRHGEGARLRAGEGAGAGSASARDRVAVADDHDAGDDAGRA